MKLANVTAALAMVTLVGIHKAAAEDSLTDEPGLKEIREFPVETLASLGREIYRHDQFAWIATDLLQERITLEKLRKEGGVGWIVDANPSGEAVVRFLRSKNDTMEIGHEVVFPQTGKPKVRRPPNRKLSPAQLARATALKTASNDYAGASLPWCGGTFNPVVLDDPDGSGFLVYLLRPIPTHGVIPVGGHFRITVSNDGKKTEQIDQLFASCLSVNPREGAPEDVKVVAAFVTHLVSPTPLETHVFLSLQAKLPMYVATRDGFVWIVNDGVIAKTDYNVAEEASAAEKQDP